MPSKEWNTFYWTWCEDNAPGRPLGAVIRRSKRDSIRPAYITREDLPGDPVGNIDFWTDYWEKTHPDADWARWPEEDKVATLEFIEKARQH